MIGLRGFFGCKTEEVRKIGYRARGQFFFVQREKMRQVAAGWSYIRRRHIVQTEFGDRLRQRASKTGCLGDGREIGQVFRGCGGVNDARCQSFDAKAGDGRKREAAHGLSGEVRGKLRERQRVNTLAAGWKSADGEFRGGGSRGRDDDDFAVRVLCGQERGGAIEQRGVGAGVNERARDHR